MKTEYNTFNTMEPKMQVTYYTFRIKALGDKYFGRKITSDPEEMQKIFNSYVNRKMEHVCSSIKDIEFCQCVDDFGIRYAIDGEQQFIVVVKVCSYMPIKIDYISMDRIIDHYLPTYHLTY